MRLDSVRRAYCDHPFGVARIGDADRMIPAQDVASFFAEQARLHEVILMAPVPGSRDENDAVCPGAIAFLANRG